MGHGPCVCVGIGGGSGAGKTTLCRRLLSAFAGVGTALVELDCYYRDRSALSPGERAELNYDHPDALESSLLVRHVRDLKEGRAVECPVYDFATHSRSGTRRIEPGRLVVVEGILALHWPELRELFDIAVFVDMDEAARFHRRMRRDIRERGRTAESVREQFQSTVAPMHALFVEPCRRYAHTVLRGAGRLNGGVDCLIAEIGRRLEAGAAMGMAETIRERFAESIAVKQKASEGLTDEIIAVVQEMIRSLRMGGKVILCGNGGSAADAQHIAGEFVGRFKLERNPVPALALNANSSVVTAIGNDYGYDEVFSRQTAAHGRRGDVFIGISTSGNSECVVRAANVAKELGLYTVGLTGAAGGRLAECVDVALKAPSDSTPRIQETHITIAHIICELVEAGLFGPAAN